MEGMLEVECKDTLEFEVVSESKVVTPAVPVEDVSVLIKDQRCSKACKQCHIGDVFRYVRGLSTSI